MTETLEGKVVLKDKITDETSDGDAIYSDVYYIGDRELEDFISDFEGKRVRLTVEPID
jgi:hypothetical protein